MGHFCKISAKIFSEIPSKRRDFPLAHDSEFLEKDDIMARIIKRDTLIQPNTISQISVSDVYNNFLFAKKQTCSKSTYDIYEELGRRYIIPGLSELSDDNISAVNATMCRTLLDDYASCHVGGGTNFLYRHLKAFINWTWKEYEFHKNPMDNVTCKRPDTPPKQGITQEEVDLLLKTIKKSSAFPERDTAFIMILCDTGIRRSSIVNMKMKDVDLGHAEITVFEKDQQYHIKGIGATTCKAIRKYLLCLSDIKPEDPFWITLEGTAFTENGMVQVLRHLCEKAGIPLHLFHDFRRYYALQLYKDTGDIFSVSRALDHKGIEVTKRYLAIADKDDIDAIRRHSPMDRKYGQTGIKVRR